MAQEMQETTVALREDIIKTAVKFLQNPNVQRSAINQKQQFLRSKGLTEDEIQSACERAGAFSPLSTQIDSPNGVFPTNTSSYIIPRPQSRLARFRDILSSLALLGGIAYAVYMFYKKFIEPYLFVSRNKKRKTIEENIEQLTEVVHKNSTDMKENIAQIQMGLSKINQNVDTSYTMNQQIIDIKSEIGSLKSLLLSRKQFPSISAKLVPPSIPAWQLTSAQQTHNENENENKHFSHDNEIENENDCHGKTEDLLMDSGSGSGSSETDVVTKNSDSSLEIIS